MNTIEIFERQDHAQRPDTFTNDINWAKDNGAKIEHHDLETSAVSDKINGFFNGAESLPIILVNGELVMQSRYPSRNELADWANISEAEAVFAKVSCCSGGKWY
jgi:hypothetical protein